MCSIAPHDTCPLDRPPQIVVRPTLCFHCYSRSAASHSRAVALWDHEANSPFGPLSFHLSSNVVVAWRCDVTRCGHTWQTAVHHITDLGQPSGCPSCVSSFAEKLVRDWLVSNRAVRDSDWIPEWPRRGRGWPALGARRYDFLIVGLGIGWLGRRVRRILEVDGAQHFVPGTNGSRTSEVERVNDMLKMQQALEHGMPFIRVTASALRHSSRPACYRWLRAAVDRAHSQGGVIPIILHDEPCYRKWAQEEMQEGDFGPHVKFKVLFLRGLFRSTLLV